MLFLISKVHIISIQQIEQFWCLETYKLFVPAEKQLAHPLFSSNSAPYSFIWPYLFIWHLRVSDTIDMHNKKNICFETMFEENP